MTAKTAKTAKTKTTKKPAKAQGLGNAAKAKGAPAYPKPELLGPVDPGRLMTLVEAADRLTVSPATLRREVKEGRLAVVRVGRRNVRIRPADFEAYVTSRLTRRAG